MEPSAVELVAISSVDAALEWAGFRTTSEQASAVMQSVKAILGDPVSLRVFAAISLADFGAALDAWQVPVPRAAGGEGGASQPRL